MTHFVPVNDMYIPLERATVSILLDNVEPKSEAEKIRNSLTPKQLSRSRPGGFYISPMNFQEALRYCLDMLLEHDDSEHMEQEVKDHCSYWKTDPVNLRTRMNQTIKRFESDGRERWYRNGKLHRDGDQPAIVSNDYTAWYQQPAIVSNDYTAWYQRGHLHRIGGPAVVHANGCLEWFFEGYRITREELEWIMARPLIRAKRTIRNCLTARIHSPPVADQDGAS
jgi:hypothetical protein